MKLTLRERQQRNRIVTKRLPILWASYQQPPNTSHILLKLILIRCLIICKLRLFCVIQAPQQGLTKQVIATGRLRISGQKSLMACQQEKSWKTTWLNLFLSFFLFKLVSKQGSDKAKVAKWQRWDLAYTFSVFYTCYEEMQFQIASFLSSWKILISAFGFVDPSRESGLSLF